VSLWGNEERIVKRGIGEARYILTGTEIYQEGQCSQGKSRGGGHPLLPLLSRRGKHHEGEKKTLSKRREERGG